MITVVATAAGIAAVASAVLVAVLLAHSSTLGERARFVQLETERQGLAEALASSEQTFRTAFENAPIGISLISVAEDHSDRFVRVNSAFARLLGRPVEDLEGRLVADLTHPEDRHLVKRRVAAHDGPASMQKRYLHADGRPIWVEVSYSLVPGPEGAEPYFIAQIEDIGTRKESERALLDALRRQQDAARHLREVDTLRTDMVAAISHELRTPLASIKGYIEILGDGDAGDLGEEQAALVRTVADSTERLTELVDDLLALAELDATTEALGAPATDDPPVDLCELVTAAVQAVAPVTAAKRQTVTTDLPPGAVRVRGDFRLLERAVVNLLSNSSKYSGPKGRIGVAVRLKEASAGRQVELSVTDDGIGIREADRARLFDRFFRSASAQDHAASGSGLGLAIVRSVVERHGGQVGVVSHAGPGSTFTLTLPALRAVSPLTAVPAGLSGPTPTGDRAVPTQSGEPAVLAHPVEETSSWRAS